MKRLTQGCVSLLALVVLVILLVMFETKEKEVSKISKLDSVVCDYESQIRDILNTHQNQGYEETSITYQAYNFLKNNIGESLCDQYNGDVLLIQILPGEYSISSSQGLHTVQVRKIQTADGRNYFTAVVVKLTPFAIIIQKKMREYLDWIAIRSNEYELDMPLPEIRYISQEMLMVGVYGSEAVAKADLEGYVLLEISALYKTGVIFLLEDFDHNDPMYQHTLVHELVHHLQYLKSGSPSCAGLWEYEAFELQTQWQNEFNSPAERPDMLIPTMQWKSCKRGF